jgi:hypothetical protein
MRTRAKGFAVLRRRGRTRQALIRASCRSAASLKGTSRHCRGERFPNMRRTNWKTVSTLVTMAVLAGCQDSMVSAPQQASVGPTLMMMAPDAAPRLSLTNANAMTTSTDFVVGPQGGVFMVGNHAVVIPAHGICNPATSSYGPGTWDSPCRALEGSLKIHAEVRVTSGGTWVDFSPALRFVPSNNAKDWAWIYMYTPNAAGAKNLSGFNILYASSIGGATMDEAAQDASLRTYVDTRAGLSARRIKHFSGYTSSGKECYTGPDCVETP